MDKTIGSRIRKRREYLKITPENLAEKIQAPLKYIAAFEENNYGVFPAKVYAAGFLKKVLKALSLEKDQELWNEFHSEWSVQNFRKTGAQAIIPVSRKSLFYLNPGRLGVLSVLAIVLLLFIFWGMRIGSFLEPPRLVIIEPEKEKLVFEPVIRARGFTEKESRLTINGQEININEDGGFDAEFELAAGLNALEFTVRDRFGKETREMRYVFSR